MSTPQEKAMKEPKSTIGCKQCGKRLRNSATRLRHNKLVHGN